MSKVDREVAERDFDRFIDCWEIDANIDLMSSEDKESFQQQKGRIINQNVNGRATINDAGMIAYTLAHTTGPDGEAIELVFTIPKGVAYIGMDKLRSSLSLRSVTKIPKELKEKNVPEWIITKINKVISRAPGKSRT